ncbi:GM13219 [Drosophila sechellia]|uniref:GM13219 n=1 Tax=Drosophila sechellia TaxID=7238 RepID=B4ILB9_DROSE|nr:GM13219 [Drosophila sechellia]
MHTQSENAPRRPHKPKSEDSGRQSPEPGTFDSVRHANQVMDQRPQIRQTEEGQGRRSCGWRWSHSQIQSRGNERPQLLPVNPLAMRRHLPRPCCPHSTSQPASDSHAQMHTVHDSEEDIYALG